MTLILDPNTMRKSFIDEAKRRYPCTSDDMTDVFVETNRYHGFIDACNWLERLVADAGVRVPLGTPIIFVSGDTGVNLLRVTVERHPREGLVVTNRSAELISLKAQEWVHLEDGEVV